MALSEFQLLRPPNVPHALAILNKYAGEGARATRILAGGTDLLPSMRQKLFEPEHVLDIRRIPELKGIRETDQGTEIGALTTLHEIEHSELLRAGYPVLGDAAKAVASPVLRNMGTIGGNIWMPNKESM